MLQKLMKYSRKDVGDIDHEKVMDGKIKMFGKYFQKINKHDIKSNKKKLIYSFKKGKMKGLMIKRKTDASRQNKDNLKKDEWNQEF